MSAKESRGPRPRFVYRNGAALAPQVALNETVLAALVREYYARVTGGKCDRCPSAEYVRLVRRDGKKRKRGVYGLADIVNAGKVVGGELVLPTTYTLRCPRCTARMAAALKKAERRRNALPAERRTRSNAIERERQNATAASPVVEAAEREGVKRTTVAESIAGGRAEGLVSERDADVERFIREMPAAAVAIEVAHGPIVGALTTYDFRVKGRPPVVAGWIVLAGDRRLRVPLAEAA